MVGLGIPRAFFDKKTCRCIKLEHFEGLSIGGKSEVLHPSYRSLRNDKNKFDHYQTRRVIVAGKC